jgi:hypothetical protein
MHIRYIFLVSFFCYLFSLSAMDELVCKDLFTVAMVHDWLNIGLACTKQQTGFKTIPQETQGIIFAQVHPWQDITLWEDDDPVCVKTVRIPADIHSFAVADDQLVFTVGPIHLSPFDRYGLGGLDMAEHKWNYTYQSVERHEYGDKNRIVKDVKLVKYLSETGPWIINFRYTVEKKQLTYPYEQTEKVRSLKEIKVTPESLGDRVSATRFNTLLVKAKGHYEDTECVELDEPTNSIWYMNKNVLPKMTSLKGDLNQLPSTLDYRFITVHKEKTQCDGKDVIDSILKIYVPRSKVCMQHYCVFQAFMIARGMNHDGANELTKQAWALFRNPRYRAIVREAAERYKCVSWFEAWDALPKKQSN